MCLFGTEGQQEKEKLPSTGLCKAHKPRLMKWGKAHKKELVLNGPEMRDPWQLWGICTVLKSEYKKAVSPL